MKKIAVFIIALVIIGVTGCQKKKVTRSIAWNAPIVDARQKANTFIQGKILNSNYPEIIVSVEGFSDTATIDQQGNYVFNIPLLEEGYFVLRNGRTTIRVFVRPGDQLTVNFNTADVFNSLSFAGKGSEPNQYLKSKYQLMLQQQMPLENLFAKPAMDFKQLVDSLYIVQKIQLDDFIAKNAGLSPYFIKSEQAALFYDRAQQLTDYAVNSPTTCSEVKDTYFTFLDKTNTSDSTLLHVYEYRIFLENRLSLLVKENVGNERFLEIQPGELASEKLVAVTELTQSRPIADYLMHSVVLAYVRQRGFTNSETLFQYFEQHCTDTLLKNPLLKAWHKYQSLNSKAKAPVVFFKDITGKQFSFDQFTGKYIYVDVWASWCLPCRREAPFFEELKAKYKGKEIAFISLSIDQKEADWRGFIENRRTPDDQYLVSDVNKFADDYQIRTIPRFMIIGPDGSLINSDAPRPSDKQTGWLDSLPGKRAI